MSQAVAAPFFSHTPVPASDCQNAGEAAALLRTTAEIRRRAHDLLARARRGESAWFQVADASVLHQAAQEVAAVTRERYGRGPIPYHSRWRHFEAGGIDRLAELKRRLADLPPASQAKAHIDLVVVSVLLDAGAGPDWRYVEASTGQTFTRSEGLGVASYYAFMGGLFSSDPQRPLQADAAGLRALVPERLAEAFQVSDKNPLVGMAGRTGLLRRLGEAMAQQPAFFGQAVPRPGALFDALVGSPGVAAAPTASVEVHSILSVLLNTLSAIWPAANHLVPADATTLLGDCWRHSAVSGPGLSHGWMPFHKLSQWLSYSLIEPFQAGGVQVQGLDQLTGLPEYRNGGLLLDAGVLIPIDPSWLQKTWQTGDEFIVEWRALTVALLDELAPLVRAELGASAAELPLACVLEGGTWATGRVLAARARAGGGPPLSIVSDGTVF